MGRGHARAPLQTAALVLAAAALAPQAEAQAPDRVLSEASVREGDNCAQLDIALNVPVRLISAFPPGTASELRVRLAPIELTDASMMSANRESIRPVGSEKAGISRVEFEGDGPQGPTLTISFDHAVHYRLDQGSDFRSLILTVLGPGDSKVCAPQSKATRARGLGPKPAMAPLPAAAIVAVPAAETDAGLSSADNAALAQARAAIVGSDNPRAIEILNQLLAHLSGPGSASAQELLGVARERNTQFAHAKTAYQAYLKLVPQGPGADRVRQRLAALIAKTTPRRVDAGPAFKETRSGGGVWNASGSVSTYYMRDESYMQFSDNISHTTVDQTDTNLNQLMTAGDALVSYSSPDFKMKLRLTGAYTNDFRKNRNDISSLSNLFIETTAPKLGLYGKFGRQTLSNGGVLGRFDGAVVSARVLPMVKVQLVAGAPVDSPKFVRLDPHRFFYGVSVPIGRIAKSWDVDVYAIEQRSSGMLDRRAVGAELRYITPGRSLFAAVDYDIHFNQLNFALLNGSLAYKGGGTLSFAYDYRKAPLLFADNAIIGQSVYNLGQLRAFYSDSEIKQLAQDRSALSQTLNFGVNHPLSERFSVNADLTVAHFGDMPASGGVPAMKGTKVETYLSTQLVGQGLLKSGDSSIVGFRYANTTTSDRWVVDLTERYPWSKTLRLNPTVSFIYRTNRRNNGDEISIQPLLRATYNAPHKIQFEPEIGLEYTRDNSSGGRNTITGYHVYLALRRDF
jgi:hypothetical protein